MTDVRYDILYKGITIERVNTYKEAKQLCEINGAGWTYKAAYIDFKPKYTPKYWKKKEIKHED